MNTTAVQTNMADPSPMTSAVSKGRPTNPSSSDRAPPRAEAVALAAMQEAATILMEADQKKRSAQAPPELSTTTNSSNAIRNTTNSNANSNKRARTSSTRIPWETRLHQLAEYKREHGNLLIPIRYKANPSLGKFVHNTREQYKIYTKVAPEGYKKRCSLTAERIQQLKGLGFVFSTERSRLESEDWNARLQQLKDYKETTGDTLVPHGYKPDPSFGEWVHRQRTAYNTHMKNPKPNPLLEGRIAMLKGVGFNFTVHNDKWMEQWGQLKEYRKKHGDCLVPTHYAENPKLGRWVHTQRHQNRMRLKGKKSCMTIERFELLNQLDFAWVVRATLERPRATWQQRFEELVKFHGSNGHFRVDAMRMPQLNKFCLDQRYRLRLLKKNQGKDVTKRMGPDRVKALSEIGFTLETVILDKEGAICDSAREERVKEKATVGTESNLGSDTTGGPNDPSPSGAPHREAAPESAAERDVTIV
eukprot:CAMPEP_0113605450 /NCGR_PEP_ID=MMETSP0017_2-20120614/2335_1 /TAXON_ID=2856 /ORGANISM="Cylindrotheca closterium" /LENGTH=473 /DNA_ID=CAMNT_0000513943 /DNA_START=116 /DNA_END=1537 /DNA_ORIENTATION=+ /assembly_acc=CAM_ASM_000147